MGGPNKVSALTKRIPKIHTIHCLFSFHLVPVQLLPDTKFRVGIAYHHHTHDQKRVMKELLKCLQKEQDYKQISMEMIVPRLSIKSIYLHSSYRSWLVVLVVIIVVIVLVGIVVEVLHRKIYPRRPTKSDDSKEIGK